MRKIKIQDLPGDQKITLAEMKAVQGGGLWSWWSNAVSSWQDDEDESFKTLAGLYASAKYYR